jgi:hypothetical protein
MAAIHLTEQDPLPPLPPPKVDPEVAAGRASTVGLGVGLNEHPKGWLVGLVQPNAPAAGAGIKRGDVITAINNRPARSLGIAEIRALLGGQPGRIITIDLLTPTEKRTLVVQNARYVRTSVAATNASKQDTEPYQTVQVHYDLGGREFLLFQTKERGRAMPIGDETRHVLINGAAGMVAFRNQQSKRSVMWSYDGTTYHLSDYRGVLDLDTLLRIARSIR